MVTNPLKLISTINLIMWLKQNKGRPEAINKWKTKGKRDELTDKCRRTSIHKSNGNRSLLFRTLILLQQIVSNLVQGLKKEPGLSRPRTRK